MFYLAVCNLPCSSRGSPLRLRGTSLTFNAIQTAVTGTAKGSAIYSDQNVTYSMDVQFASFDAASHTAWFIGQITSVTGEFGGCCQVGHWVLYEVQDNGEPGIGVDKIWGYDLTQGKGVADAITAVGYLGKMPDGSGPMVITDGNIQVH